MLHFEFSQAPAEIPVTGRFDATCTLSLSPASLEAIRSGKLKVSIAQEGNKPGVSHAHITVSSARGKLAFFIAGHHTRATLGHNTSGVFNFRLWRDSAVSIGDNTTAASARIECDQSTVTLGADCMLSDGVLIQSSDQHGIVDLETGQIVNHFKRQVNVGDHVWLGRKCILMPDISIGRGSVIGTGAIVTQDIPEMTVAVGVPARVVKSNTTWSRAADSLDDAATAYLAEYRQHTTGTTSA